MSGSSLDCPGASLGTITNLVMLRGLRPFYTTRVLSVKPMITFAVAALPSQFVDFTVGSF